MELIANEVSDEILAHTHAGSNKDLRHQHANLIYKLIICEHRCYEP